MLRVPQHDKGFSLIMLRVPQHDKSFASCFKSLSGGGPPTYALLLLDPSILEKVIRYLSGDLRQLSLIFLNFLTNTFVSSLYLIPILFGSSALFNALDPKESRSSPEGGRRKMGVR